MASTLKDLEQVTSDFFKKYLPHLEVPQWSEKWEFKGGIPQGDKRGCYAWFTNDGKLTYIGLGIGKNSGRYEGNGLGQRLNNYFKWTKKYTEDGKKIYEQTKEDVDYIRTLAFPEDEFYMAAAFEIYAITNLNGLINKTHSVG